MTPLRVTGISLLLLVCPALAVAQSWSTKLDKDVRFYQPSDMGVVIVGTEKSFYAIDGSSGDAWFTKRLINPSPSQRWVLITSAWHMPRAMGCFRKVGFAVEPWPVERGCC